LIDQVRHLIFERQSIFHIRLPSFELCIRCGHRAPRTTKSCVFLQQAQSYRAGRDATAVARTHLSVDPRNQIKHPFCGLGSPLATFERSSAMLSSAGASKIFQLSPLAPPLHSLNAPLREAFHHLSTPLAIVSCFLPRFAPRASTCRSSHHTPRLSAIARRKRPTSQALQSRWRFYRPPAQARRLPACL